MNLFHGGKGFSLRAVMFHLGLIGMSLSVLSGGSVALANDDAQMQVEPVEYLINFKVTGKAGGFTLDGIPFYTMDGPGYAPKEIFSDGEVSDAIEVENPIAQLSGAKIVFDGMPSDPVINFTCLPGSCNILMKDGAKLVSSAGLQLQGRAINMWGPVVNSPDFDPVNGLLPIRILGCGGLREVNGKGRVANMVGSICFNGVMVFNKYDQTVLTGSSKCSITLHTPYDATVIPK